MRTLCTLSIVYIGALPLYLCQSLPVFPGAVGHLMLFLLAEHDVQWKETIIQVSNNGPYSCLGHYDGKKSHSCKVSHVLEIVTFLALMKPSELSREYLRMGILRYSQAA